MHRIEYAATYDDIKDKYEELYYEKEFVLSSCGNNAKTPDERGL